MKASGEARRIYEAALRSGWDTYRGAIEAACAGDARGIVDCLRGRKPLTADDRFSLADYIATRVIHRRWPKGLGDALLTKTEADYDTIADFVEKIVRRRGRKRNEPVHDATRLAEVLMSVGLCRDAAIKRACEIVSEETDTPVSDEKVRHLLDRPKKRRRRF